MVCCFLLEIRPQSKLELDGEGDTFCESSAIWVQTSEIQCQTGPQKWKRPTEQKRTALMFGAEKFTPYLGVKEILFSSYPSRCIVCSMYPVRTGLGLQKGRSTSSSSLQPCSSALYHIPYEQGHHLYWQHNQDSNRISVEGEWPHQPCSFSFFPGALLVPNIFLPVSFSPLSPSLSHIQAHPISVFILNLVSMNWKHEPDVCFLVKQFLVL